MGYELITSSHAYPLQCLGEMPEKVRGDFDYVEDEHEPRFICYRGEWYDVHDSQRIEPSEKGKRRFFTDISVSEESDYSVYAYFVFRERD